MRVVAVAGLAVLLSAGCSSTGGGAHASRPRSSVADTYGALPTFLPTVSNRADAVSGAPGHPAVTAQGVPVHARVGGGSVQVTVTGPVVPGEGLPHVADATTCTWTVTFRDPTTTVPIRLSDFLAVDEDGHAYRLHFVPGATRPPGALRRGQATTFALRVVMPTGEGVMRWQPDGHALAVWDFVVEND